DRAAPQRHRDSRRGVVGANPEHGHRTLLLAEAGTADEEHVVEPFELDDAVDTQVGHGTSRKLALERNVNGDRTVLNRRVDARHAAGNEAIAGVDGGLLANLDVTRLRLGDLDLRLQ